MTQLVRSSQTQQITIASGGATSGAMVLDGYAFGGFILPATFDGTAMTFTVCDTFAGTYVALEDATGAAISLTVEASKAYALPADLFAFPFAKLVAGTNQSTTDTVIPVCVRA
jgi:hypothetical protein